MTEWVVRGVPGALAMDAWWLGDTAPPPKSDGSEAKLAPARGVLALLALTGIGDFLFFQQAVGLSLAIFAGAVFLAVLATLPTRARLYPSLLLLLSVLPVIDYVQPLSLGFLAVGLTASLLWARGGTMALAQRSLALWTTLPWRRIGDSYHQTATVMQSDTLRGQWRAARRLS